ncbi:MAG: glycosyltransferase [Gemmatimonadetes bacterium]|nr:glycosyltransferase [Gemmatimonadota bacterium]
MIETARHAHEVNAPSCMRTDTAPDVAADRVTSVAAVIDTVILSGPGRQLVAQAALQQSRDTNFRIVTFRRAGRPVSPFVAYAESRGIACDVIEETGRLDMSVLPRVREALARAGATVVQTHGYRPSAIVRSLRALGWYRGGWVGFYHGATAEDWKVRLYDALDRRLLRSADHVVVMSRPQLALFADLGARGVGLQRGARGRGSGRGPGLRAAVPAADGPAPCRDRAPESREGGRHPPRGRGVAQGRGSSLRVVPGGRRPGAGGARGAGRGTLVR